MVTVERVEARHLAVILPWWQARDLGEVPEWILPPCGFVAIDDGGPCAAMWLAITEGVPVGRVEWMITRPGMSARRSREVCRAMFRFLEAEAFARGLKVLFAASYRHQMVREFEACGFVETVSGVTHCAKEI